MSAIDTAGHGPDDPLTPKERVDLLAWARTHPDGANHVAAVLVLRYEAALGAAEQARDAARATITDLRLHAAHYVGAMVEDQYRLARLAALETAARAMYACGPEEGERFATAYSALLAAVAALDGPAGKAG
jgi:hypothetical protein